MLPWHEVSMFSHPAEFDLYLVSSVKLDTDGLEGICTGTWDVIALWLNPSGYLIGNDASCDCQEPFENTRADQLTPIVFDKDQIFAFVSDVWQDKPMGVIVEAVDTLLGLG